MLLQRQRYVSPQRPLPVDDKGNSSTTVAISGEALTLYYFSGTTPTVDAGQAAGTVVVAKLAYDNIKNALGTAEATKDDTSLVLTSTVLTTEVHISDVEMEEGDAASLYTRATALTAHLSNGQFVSDYANGVIYGKKATSGTTVTAAYTINQALSAPSSAAPSVVDVNKWGGTATTLGQKTASASVPVVIASDQGGAQVDVMKYGGTATTLGQKNTTASIPVTLASDQPPVRVVENSVYSEDTPHTTGEDGNFILEVRRDVCISSAGTDGDYASKNQDADGYSYTRDKAFDSGSSGLKAVILNPDSGNFLEETKVDTTNLAANTYYYPSSAGQIPVGRHTSIQGRFSGGVTMSLEGTNDDAGSPDWEDLTLMCPNFLQAGIASASWVDTNVLFFLENFNMKAWRVKIVTSDNTNAVQINIRMMA